MADEAAGRYRSPIVGDLSIPLDQTAEEHHEAPDPHERLPMIIELNVLYPGGLDAVRKAFYEVWSRFESESGGSYPRDPHSTTEPDVPHGLELLGPKLYQCVISRWTLRSMVELDQEIAERLDRPTAVFRVWPDYQLDPQIDRSAPTVKADAAWASYGARGKRIVWAVIDSGIDGRHPHFSGLELASEATGQPPADGLTTNLHRDFSYLVQLSDGTPDVVPEQPGHGVLRPTSLLDDSGHGTHVAGIISGRVPDKAEPKVAISKEQEGVGFVKRQRVGLLSGMAPDCELVSLKVMRRNRLGNWVTSSAAVIRALNYLRNEVNVDPAVLRVHGVNMSLGCEWSPQDYASGQSPLCQALNQLVATGVVVVVSAGNLGAKPTKGTAVSTAAVLGSITEPAHAEDCIAVGSTHRDAPYSFGVTWTSGKGPTLDGRMKPDVVAPGEWITSAATGSVRKKAGLPAPLSEDPMMADDEPRYAEQSGTSMAAPHVSGVIAAFLSARPEFIGRPRQVKQLLMDNATDLGRERYAQGAGLVDLMRMLSNV
jgi:subtilisin family serine protease